MNINDFEEYIRKDKNLMAKEKQKFVSTGSTILDTALDGGIGTGTIINLFSEPGVGKTSLAQEIMFQAAKKYGNKFKAQYYDVEEGNFFDDTIYGGFNIQDYMEPCPSISQMVGKIATFADGLKSDEIGIAVVDSVDSLVTEEDQNIMVDRQKAASKNEDKYVASYGASKAKDLAQAFRTLAQHFTNKPIILILISQVRDNLTVSGPYVKAIDRITVSGGKAIQFYTSTRLFLKEIETYEVEGREIGKAIDVFIYKARTPYTHRHVTINYYNGVAFSDVASNVDFLYDLRNEKNRLDEAKCKSITWKESEEEYNKDTLKTFCEENELMDIIRDGSRYTENKALEVIQSIPEINKLFADKFGIVTRDQLISLIETEGLEEEIAEKAKAKWLGIEKRIAPNIKKRTL